MSGLVSITLTAPAKISGVRQPAGATVQVPAELAQELAGAGAVSPQAVDALSAVMDGLLLASDFDAAVKAEVAERMAATEAELTAAHERIAELEGQLRDGIQQTQPSEAAADGDKAKAAARTGRSAK